MANNIQGRQVNCFNSVTYRSSILMYRILSLSFIGVIIINMGEKFNISWHTYEVHLKEMLQEMFMSPNFSDVTIVCDDQKKIKAHRNVLSASSPIFKNILQQHGEESKHPIIYLRGIQHSEMESIMQFVYYGQATFYQERINELLAVAKNLEIKGLSDVKMLFNGIPAF